jgi:hypothetical protein
MHFGTTVEVGKNPSANCSKELRCVLLGCVVKTLTQKRRCAMRRTEFELRMRIMRNAFKLKLRKVTISDSHVSFPWLPMLWNFVRELPEYVWQWLKGDE